MNLPFEIIFEITKNFPPYQIPKIFYSLGVRLKEDDYRYLGTQIFGDELFQSAFRFFKDRSDKEVFKNLSFLSKCQSWDDFKFFLFDLFKVPQPDLGPFFNSHNLGPLFILGRLWFRGYDSPLLFHLIKLSLHWAKDEGFLIEINDVLSSEDLFQNLEELEITLILIIIFRKIIQQEVEFYFLDYDFIEIETVIEIIINEINEEIKKNVDLVESYWS